MKRRASRSTGLSIGCDLGGTEIKAVALAGRRILTRSRFPTPVDGGADGVIEGILSAAREAAAVRPGPGTTLGMALPGFLDERRSSPVYISHLPFLAGRPLRQILHRRLGWPVVLEVDSNAGAFGESRLGAGRGARRLLYLTLGTGVGAAMIVGGEILRVSHHTVGQVAHIPLDPEGPRCSCGSRGCFESVLGARGIVWRAARAARSGSNLAAGARKSPLGLSEAARNGSAEARRVLAEVGTLLGAGLALLANLLSPDRIVVGGGIRGAGELIFGPAKSALRRRVHPHLRESLVLVPSRLGPFAGAAGAALLGRVLAEEEGEL